MERPVELVILVMDARKRKTIQTLRLRLPRCDPQTAHSLLTLIGEWAQGAAKSLRGGYHPGRLESR